MPKLSPLQRHQLAQHFPEIGEMLSKQEQTDLLKQLVSKKSDNKVKIDLNGSEVATLQGEKGDKGDAGNDGYTPQFGKDYFTDDHIRALLELSTPTKGKHYFTPQEVNHFIELVTPKKGVDYRDGKNGIDGLDGRNGRDGKDGTDGKSVKLQEVLGALKDKEGKLSLSMFKDGDAITKAFQKVNMNDMRWHGSGLNSVVHDSTLTGTGTPSSPLSVVSSVGSNYSETPSPAIDGVENIFTTVHNINFVFGVYINGAFQHPASYTIFTNHVIFTVAPDISLAGMPFTIIYS